MVRRWVQDRRPYYDVYPAIIPMFLKLDLSKVPTHSIKAPMNGLLVRFPTESNPLLFDDDGTLRSVRSVLMADMTVEERHMLVNIDSGDHDATGQPRIDLLKWKTHDEDNVESCLDDLALPDGSKFPGTAVRDVAKVICSLCLLADDPNLIEPEPLSKDRRTWESTQDVKYSKGTPPREKGVGRWSSH